MNLEGYNGAVFFRALKNFVVQWGMLSRSEEAEWKEKWPAERVTNHCSELPALTAGLTLILTLTLLVTPGRSGVHPPQG